MILLMVFVFILAFHRINGKLLLNSDSSYIIVLRHIRLSTDNEYYRIRCPYHLNHLTLTLLNYSNENCFDLYSKSINNACIEYRSPCQFLAKPVQLSCCDRSYSNHVDITYQCTLSPSTSSSTKSTYNQKISMSSTKENELILSSTYPSNKITVHALAFPSISFRTEESIGLFLIGFAAVFILWLTVCCMWFIRCGHINKEDGKEHELFSFEPYQKPDIINFKSLSETKPMIVGNLSGQANTGGLDNICVHVNPLENKRVSSLKIMQIV